VVALVAVKRGVGEQPGTDGPGVWTGLLAAHS
jgi:hypothetical protein